MAAASDPRLIVYCLVAPAHADVVEELREHYRDADPRVEVLVDRRVRQRRSGDEHAPRPSARERRGRQDRRRFAIPRRLDPPPPGLADRAGPLRWVQRMLPVGEATELLTNAEVLAAVRAGDAEAPAELYWRFYHRLHSRLSVVLGDARRADAAIGPAFGRVLDALERGPADESFDVLMYREVDALAEELAQVQEPEVEAPVATLQVSDPRLDEPVTVADYDERWVAEGRADRDQILRLLGDELIAVQHIGATAVPGAAARPVIDLLAGVESLPLSAEAVEVLTGLGYEHCGDGGSPGRELLRRRDRRATDLHVVVHDGAAWEDALGLRDHLRRQAAAVERWSAVRRQAADMASGSTLRYFDLRRLALEELATEARRQLVGGG